MFTNILFLSSNICIFIIDQWKYGFKKENNKEDTFHSKDGDQKTNFLYHEKLGNVNFFLDNKNQVKVLSLPYKDENFSMIFYLPTDEKTKMEKMTELLQQINLKSLSKQPVAPVQIPKFTMKLKINDLKEIMESLGAEEVWTPSANLKGKFII